MDSEVPKATELINASKTKTNTEDKYNAGASENPTFLLSSIADLNLSGQGPMKLTNRVNSDENIVVVNKEESCCRIFWRRTFKRITYDDLTHQSAWSVQQSVVSEFPPNVDYNEQSKRGQWGAHMEFILSCVGFAVGLGNVWRFPFKCYEGGGGAFFVPYFFMLFFVALPIFFMELSIGQFASLGSVGVWNCCPLFRGVGISTVVISGFVALYYNVIIAWSLLFLFSSFKPTMPWTSCNNKWNDARCVPIANLSETYTNITSNTTYRITVLSDMLSSEQYWNREVLGRITKDGSVKTMNENPGAPGWKLSLCLVLSWIIIFLILMKGIKTSGKIVYFTATFPYVILVMLIIVGATLEGSGKGVKFYITPVWSKVLEANTWKLAAEQIFYSMGIGFGSFITMASFSGFNDNCYRDSILIALINAFTSIISGFAVFELIGFIAHQRNLDIDKVGLNGPGLIFIAYPEGLSTIKGANFFCVMLFFMVFLLGVDSQLAMVETVITAIKDEYKEYFNSTRRSMALIATFSFIAMSIGFLMCTPAGIYYLNILDSQSCSFSLMIVTFTELVAIVLAYGGQKFIDDLYMMLHFHVNYYWLLCWLVTAPLAIVFIFVFSMVNYQQLQYGNYVYPMWAELVGWVVSLSAFMAIPIYAIYHFIITYRANSEKDFMKICHLSIKETEDWGPAMQYNWLGSKRYRDKLRKIQGENPVVKIDENTNLNDLM